MKKLLLLFVLCLCFPVVDKACTSIIITGKATRASVDVETPGYRRSV